MLVDKFTLSLICSFGACLLNANHADSEYKKHDVVIEKLNNGMTYCLANDLSDDQVYVNLYVKFDRRWGSERERILSTLMEKLVVTTIEAVQQGTHDKSIVSQLAIHEPELFAVPNLILYKFDIHQPSQESIDAAFGYLSRAFENLSIITPYELHGEVEQIFDNYRNNQFHSIKPRKPFFVDDALYPGATLDGYEELMPEVSMDEVKAFFFKHYRPENMVLFVCGNLSNLAIKQTIENYFSSFVALEETKKEQTILNRPTLISNTVNEVVYPSIILASNVISEEPAEHRSNFEEFLQDPHQAFYHLPISDGERGIISRIIHTLASHNVVKLLWKKKDLEKMGKTINHVHPLRFLWSILADPKLRGDLHVIRGDFFKWNGFLDGFRRRMTEEYFNNNIAEYVPGFCKEFGLSEEIMNHHIAKRDWEGFVKAAM